MGTKMRSGINSRDIYSTWNDGLVEWIEQQMLEGRHAFYVNFMFHHLTPEFGPPIHQMHCAVKRFYGRFCTRCARNPRAEGLQHRLPRLFLFPDLPVFKKQRMNLRDATVNNGLHFNGFLFVSDDCRLQKSVEREIAGTHPKYCAHGIARIDVERLAGSMEKVTDYALKTMKRRTLEVDTILVLPRTISQLSSGCSRVTGARKARLDFQSQYNLSEETTADILPLHIADSSKSPKIKA